MSRATAGSTASQPVSLARSGTSALQRRSKSQGIELLPIETIDTAKRVRRFYSAISDLAASMDEHGLLQPVVVREVAPGVYRLVAGGRRLEAARMLRWEKIPARLISADEEQSRVLELVENLQREDLSAEEEAEALEELLAERDWSVRQLADAIKRSPSYVSRRVRIFDDPVLREAVLEHGLPVSTAQELLSAPAEVKPMLAEAAREGAWGQGVARAAVRALQNSSNSSLEETRETSSPAFWEDGVGSDDETDLDVRSRAGDAGRNAVLRNATHPREGEQNSRPSGLTRQIKQWRQTLRQIRPWDLTDADRRELRAFFHDLVLYAQAPTEKRKPILPPLPQ